MKGKEKTLKEAKKVANYNLKNQDLKCKQSQKGITLVALVVTIVVLLILAGVTIALIMNNNSIIKRAIEARDETNIKGAREQVELVMADWQIVKHTQDKTFESHLKEAFGEANVTPKGDRFNVSVNGFAFIVDSNGNIELADGITLNKSTLKLTAGGSETLTVSYSGSASGAVTWTSSNTSVATVNNGVVSIPAGVTTGTAEITATCGSYTAKCTVVIVQKVTSITISPSTLEIPQGEAQTLSVATVPSGANIEELEYTSSDTTGKITVNSEGKVTVASDVAVGVTATITVKGKLSGKTATATITVKAATLPIGEYVEYDVAYTDMYVADINTAVEGNQGFTKTNGWRILDVGSKNADGSYSGAKIISTGIPANLYYNITEGQDGNIIGDSNKPNWWGTPEQVKNLYGQTYADKGYIFYNYAGGYPNYYAATGLEKNFASIPFEQKTSSFGYNKGGYSEISKGGTPATGNITGEIFKTDKAGEVHNLTLAELNTAINKINGNNGRAETSKSDISSSYDLFYLKGLTAFNYSSASLSYWVASPYNDSYGGSTSVCNVNIGGNIMNNSNATSGVRPVVSLTSDIYKDGDIWKIK